MNIGVVCIKRWCGNVC